jgi:hypothetical protein
MKKEMTRKLEEALQEIEQLLGFRHGYWRK